jgi:uracil-DNA glycosylase family 4
MRKTSKINSRQQWLHCDRCALAHTRKHVVLGRGEAECDLLFLGEAPSKSEDLLGIPFIGPAGKLLDAMISKAVEWAGTAAPTTYFAYACACRPCDTASGDNRMPTGEELWACNQRLEWEVKTVANPRKAIFLGKLADGACRNLFPDAVSLQHPAYILKAGGLASPVGIKFIRDLSQVLMQIMPYNPSSPVYRPMPPPERD